MQWGVVFVTLIAAATANPVQNYNFYDGHKVVKVFTQSEEHVRLLSALRDSEAIDVDFWRMSKSAGGSADIRVSPERQEELFGYLQSKGLKYTVHIPNLRSAIERENAELEKRTIFNCGDDAASIDLNNYHTIEEIECYQQAVAAKHPTTASVVPIGTSHEGRKLTAVKIGNPGTNKPAVFVNGCIHAREWISCATMIYIINQLTESAGQYSDLLNKVDVYVMPVANPDGYHYTWTKDRMWRKTRSGPRNGCYGADPNRNWAFKWMVAGSSSNPCSETYAGPSPFSEEEPRQLAAFLAANNNSIQAYFDIHSYSEDFMFPFGYAEVYPNDLSKIKVLAGKATQAVNAVNGERFSYGSITDIVYPASGSSIDYTKGLLNIDYSYAMELRPDGNSFNGFILPASQIHAGATEAWAGILTVFNAVASSSR